MLTLVTPMWLFGLLLLPVIRWLHRGGRHRRAVLVSRLALWRGSAESMPAAGERRPPDPAWRRRALLAALVFVALSEPQWPQPRTGITLWVDDSLSMLTREEKGTRLVTGLALVRTLLAEVGPADVEVRTLGDPWHSLGALSDSAAATLVDGAGRKEPSVPPGALLRRDRLHWLVTDGADAALFEWPGERRPDRIIQVGSVTRNVGLERLSARRNLSDSDRVDLLLKLTNGGTATESRELVFVTDAGEMARSTQRLDAGQSALVAASIPASAKVRATLRPGDALAEDDDIVLDLTPLRRRRVATDPACPAVLLAAVGTHPALALAPRDATGAEAMLDCGTRGAASGVATLRVLADRVPTRPRGPALWSASVPESRRVRFDDDRLQVGARLQARPEDAVLLAVGDEPVIIGRAGASRLVETSLDFASVGIARGPEVPLIVNLMVDRLLGGHLLDEIATTDRGPASVRVAPSARQRTTDRTREVGGLAASAGVPSDSRLLREGSRPVLVAALLVLLWEIVALGLQAYRLRPYAQARTE